MRSFGCVVNDWADRKIDRQVRRTRARPLATGEVAGAEAALAGAILLAAGVRFVLTLPAAARWWALAALAVAVCYPFAKRFMRMPQLVLGLAFSMGIPTAYATAGAGRGGGGVDFGRVERGVGGGLRHDLRDDRPRRRHSRGH